MSLSRRLPVLLLHSYHILGLFLRAGVGRLGIFRETLAHLILRARVEAFAFFSVGVFFSIVFEGKVTLYMLASATVLRTLGRGLNELRLLLNEYRFLYLEFSSFGSFIRLA